MAELRWLINVAWLRSLKERALASCVGKESFGSWAVASAVATRRRRHEAAMQAYHCGVCRAWHIGPPLRRVKA